MTIVIGIIVGIFVFIVAVLILTGVKIVSQTDVLVIERLGSYKKILKNGVSWIFPLIDKVVLQESLKEKVIDFPEQNVITKDNVTMKIDTVVYMQIVDPKLFAYGVNETIPAIENLTATTLRNLIGDLELDQTLTSRETINEKLRTILDDATDAWGVKILRVELKNIIPPIGIQNAMEKQMRAERGKRAAILEAEGNKAASILRAEGFKQSAILKAEGTKQSTILEAEGTKLAINLINSSSPTKASLVIKGYDALMEVSRGQATTILLPTELSSLSTIATTFSEIQKKVSKTKKKETLSTMIKEAKSTKK